MFAAFLFLALSQNANAQIVKCFGDSVGLKLIHPNESGGEWIEQYFAKDAKGKWRMVLSSASAEEIKLKTGEIVPTAVRQSASRLFLEAPTFAFTQVVTGIVGRRDSIQAQLKRTDERGTIVKSVSIPNHGNVIDVRVDCSFEKPREIIEYFMDSLAFVPDGKTLSNGGTPDSTFTPGLRKGDNQVVGDHFFRDPAIVAQKGTLAAILMPDVEVLKDNRPMPTILDLDAKNGVVDATLMSYGFCDHQVVGHVWYAHDASMIRRVPKELKLAYHLIVDAQAEPFGAYRQAVKHTWDWYGRSYFDKVLPQAMPFEEYAKVCYPAAFNEQYGANKLGWFEVNIDGQECGGISSGWGFQEGWVSWQSWFNQLRSAWGLHWWGLKLKNQDWIDKSNKMLNLALAAPMDRGACPTTYQSREKKWLGSLIRPRADCYYDLTNMAWKGIWMLRWLEFADCPRKEEIERQVSDMMRMMSHYQNSDGSFPTWLTKEFKVVPILDHSAQSALPAWFMAEALKEFSDETRRTDLYAREDSESYRPGSAFRIMWMGQQLQKAADFLAKNVVDQQRWYDFETFFSCSPKKCLQMNGVIDDRAMHDPHTLSPPQNTLCMQWAAEALFTVSNLLKPEKGAKFRAAALKALDIMALYQNAWDISYRKTAYDFGGFGVQNSDGEYNDARQAQFGCTLADFGAALGRRDYFERGVAATRGAVALINHPLHEKLGIYPNPNYPLGLQPENCCHGGTDSQAGRTGFDWGEGSGLASMAWLLDKYGGVYANKRGGWVVGVDGVFVGKTGIVFDLVDFEANVSNRRKVEWFDGVKSRNSVETSFYPSLLDAALRGKASPGGGEDFSDVGIAADFTGLNFGEFQGNFVANDGSKRPASEYPWAEQSGMRIGLGLQTKYPEEWNGKEVRLVGSVKGTTYEAGPWVFYLNPTFAFSDWRMPGWTIQGNFPETPTYSERMDFGIKRGEGFIGTCENGKGNYDDEYTGTITSPEFIVSKSKMHLLVGGGNVPGAYVELIGEDGKQIFVERGKNTERMDERVWDLSTLKGKKLRIRIVDKETGGWGHINVGRVRCSD